MNRKQITEREEIGRHLGGILAGLASVEGNLSSALDKAKEERQAAVPLIERDLTAVRQAFVLLKALADAKGIRPEYGKTENRQTVLQ